ncbi:hypothetical protein Dimus_005915 [Dionaea muscipula]
MDENMSNLTSASGEASVSSSNNRAGTGTIYPHRVIIISNILTNKIQQLHQRRKEPPWKPRDQNLQHHRRGHNLPWKLKQRTNKEQVWNKLYAFPELSCVHHDPSRALSDLIGIKKHFCKKHGEKKHAYMTSAPRDMLCSQTGKLTPRPLAQETTDVTGILFSRQSPNLINN